MKFLFSLFFLLTACADPTYLAAASGQAQNQTQDAKVCTVKFKNSGLCLDWKWESAPTETDVGSFLFKIYRLNLGDGTAIPVDQDFPSVVLWMPAMGHGSSPVTTTRIDVGTYRAANVFFMMHGEWQIRFQIKNGTQVVDEAIVDISI